MIENHSNVTVQLPTDVKRKLEVLAKNDNRKLSPYLRKLFEKITEGVELPGPGEFEPEKKFIIPEPPTSDKPRYIPPPPSQIHVKDRDYSSEINPEVLKPSEKTKWLNNYL